MSYKISRRSFLKASAMTAVAVAVAGATTGCSLPTYEPDCTVDASKELVFGDLSISYLSAVYSQSSGTITVAFILKNNSDQPLTVSASDFRASSSELSERTATAVGLSIDDKSSFTLKANGSGIVNVYFEGAKNASPYPFNVKLHQGRYTIKYEIKNITTALVTPQPYFELIF